MTSIIVQGAHFPEGWICQAPVSDAIADVYEVLRNHKDGTIKLSASWHAAEKDAAMRYANEMAAYFNCPVEDKTHA